MNAITRRQIVRHLAAATSLLAAPVILPGRARAADFEFKMATTILPDHPINARAKEAAADILSQSGGRLSIKVFPGYELGSSASVLSQLHSGAIQVAAFSYSRSSWRRCWKRISGAPC